MLRLQPLLAKRGAAQRAHAVVAALLALPHGRVADVAAYGAKGRDHRAKRQLV